MKTLSHFFFKARWEQSHAICCDSTATALYFYDMPPHSYFQFGATLTLGTHTTRSLNTPPHRAHVLFSCVVHTHVGSHTHPFAHVHVHTHVLFTPAPLFPHSHARAHVLFLLRVVHPAAHDALHRVFVQLLAQLPLMLYPSVLSRVVRL